MSISVFLLMELDGSEDLPFFKYYNTVDWKSRFALGVNAAKNTNYIENDLKQKKKLFISRFW